MKVTNLTDMTVCVQRQFPSLLLAPISISMEMASVLGLLIKCSLSILALLAEIEDRITCY